MNNVHHISAIFLCVYSSLKCDNLNVDFNQRENEQNNLGKAT